MTTSKARRRTALVVILVGLLVGSWPGGVVRAEAVETTLSCHVELEVHFGSPISMEPSSGRITTKAPGTAECAGSWDGESGEYAALVAYDGYFTDATCVEGNIGGLIRVFGGDVGEPIEFPFNTRRIGAVGASRGETADGKFAYVAAVTLSRREGEDCTSKPLTGGYVEGNAVLYGK